MAPHAVTQKCCTNWNPVRPSSTWVVGQAIRRTSRSRGRTELPGWIFLRRRSTLRAKMYFSCFDPDTLKRLVHEAGFEIVETAIESQVEHGHEVPYLWLLARKQ
jgi:hypothetical protein